MVMVAVLKCSFFGSGIIGLVWFVRVIETRTREAIGEMFRPISEVLADVMADLRSEIDGTATRGSNVRASGRSTAVKGVARPAGVREGALNRTRHAQAGGGEPPRNENGKGTASEPAAKVTGVNIKQSAVRDWIAISASLRTIRRNKCAAAPQGSPTLAAHLFLVIGHASQPMA